MDLLDEEYDHPDHDRHELDNHDEDKNEESESDEQGVGLPDDERVEKETDMAKISNARDIFKQRSEKQHGHYW